MLPSVASCFEIRITSKQSLHYAATNAGRCLPLLATIPMKFKPLEKYAEPANDATAEKVRLR
jgi:hypothetical protein